MPTRLFVTGMPRAGTTLLDKVVSLHPDAHVLSQPLPLLYVDVKRAFLRSLGSRGAGATALADRYPLNDMFADNYYPPGDFLAFLDSYRLGTRFCRRSLERMIPFDGQYTKPARPLRVLDGYQPLDLSSFVTRYIGTLIGDDRHALTGSKESYCEEYTPYFLASGFRVLLVLRDPRDIISSLTHGRGREFGGSIKPLLFNIRQWRKSVAFALAHTSHPSFRAVRYEDLVTRPCAMIDEIFAFLGLTSHAEQLLAGRLRTQSGEVWLSNSSYAPASRITTGSVGRYRQHISRQTDDLIQACCLAEMRRLGYEVTIQEDEARQILEGQVPAEAPAPAELASFAWDDRRRDEEIDRLRKLGAGEFDPALFLFEPAFSRLRSPGPS